MKKTNQEYGKSQRQWTTTSKHCTPYQSKLIHLYAYELIRLAQVQARQNVNVKGKWAQSSTPN